MIDFTKPRTFVLSLLFLVILLLVVLFFISDSIGTYGVNKTVGWAWDITYYAPFIFLPLLLICFLGYSIMWLFKLKTNKVITLINLSFLILALGFMFTIRFSYMSLIFSLNALILLVVNFTFGITVKMYDKKKNLQ